MSATVTPKAAGFSMPAEWDMHEAVWLAWPSHAELWQEDLEDAQSEFIAFCEAIADIDPVTKKPRGERLHVLVPTMAAGAEAEVRLQHLPVRIHLIPFGDIWLRDTAPVFLKGPQGEGASLRFAFNGWGGKYDLPDDLGVSEQVAKASGLREFVTPWVGEGGALEVDGEGTCLTSRQCLLNPNRNPDLNQEQIERIVQDTLGVEKVLWLGDGLLNDHTDGHIDTIARFSEPGTVLCMEARDTNDPNREILETIARDLEAMTDARGRKLRVIRIPSPGSVLNHEDRLMPASYLNFYIANSTVIVPTYGSRWDEDAVAAIAKCFPQRRTVGLPAKAILTGGGAFHCISQQQPPAN